MSDDALKQLTDKHPSAQEAQPGALLFGPVEDVPHILYHEINGEMEREAALKTKSSGDPLGVDANGIRRMFACKSFKKASTGLCDAIAVPAKRLCSEFIDHLTIEPIFGK